MRIISGSRRGKKLFPVPGWDTRPTSDRVKESIFNILPSIKPEAVVLDLFAGTGALALEALSRGAAYAVLIDNATTATKVIKRNIAACGFEGRADVKDWDILMSLNCLARSNKKFSFVFMDPPYSQNAIAPTLCNLIQSNTMADGAEIIIEHSVTDPLSNLPEKMIINDERRYGKTLVSFLTYVV